MPNKTKSIMLTVAACMVLVACGGGEDPLLERYTPLSMENSGDLTVNGYLWQASLDTLSFMPMASTDGAGGVIVTDWYTHPSTPGERTKVRVDIKDPRLRSDALQVSVTRQAQDQLGNWINVPVQQSTVAGIEDAILIQARQIRLRNVTSE